MFDNSLIDNGLSALGNSFNESPKSNGKRQNQSRKKIQD